MAEVATNPLDSTHLAVETKINIDELIYLLNPDDLPLLGGVNTDGFPVIPRQPVDQPEFSWLEDEFLLPRTTLGAALADGVATSVVLATDAGESFAAGDVIRVEDEYMTISSISNDTLTVVRGALGSTGVAHADASDVIGVGTVLSEGSIGDEQFTGRTKLTNYTQIFTSKISMTRTAQRVPKYGIAGELARQTLKVMLAEGVNLEQAFLYGTKYQSGNTRATGGLEEWITSNIDSTNNFLTVETIEDQQQAAYDAGGMFQAIISRPVNFVALNNLSGAERIQTVTINDSVRGRARATYVLTEFGEVQLVRNRWCRAADAFGINRENTILRVHTPMTMQPLAKTDDTDNWMFVHECGVEVKGQRHMAKWSNLDATQTLPSTLV